MGKKKDLLLVIDMQNVYLPGRDWACPSMPGAVERICRLLREDVAEQVIFTRFAAPAHPVGTWKEYNEKNAAINGNPYLNEIVEELRPYLERRPLYDKSVYSSMRIPQVLEAAKEAERLVLSGVVAECCILSTLMDAIDAGCKVIYLTDCISGQTKQNEEAIEKIAESFAPMHTLVMDSETYLKQNSEEARSILTTPCT